MQQALAIGKLLWNARPHYQPVSGTAEPCIRTSAPTPSEFQLPTEFDFAAFVRRQRTLDKVAPWVAAAAIIMAFVLSEAWLFLVAVFAFFALPQAVSIATGDAALRPRVKRYLSAQAQWQYFNETTGEGFWKALRGTELESAVARLFRERGWQVETTAVTGDGGVDLILKRDGSVICVQCKGYAKPVTVAAVREIAGVCSASNAHPDRKSVV